MTTVFQLVDCMYGMCKCTYNSQEKYNFYDARYKSLLENDKSFAPTTK